MRILDFFFFLITKLEDFQILNVRRDKKKGRILEQGKNGGEKERRGQWR